MVMGRRKIGEIANHLSSPFDPHRLHPVGVTITRLDANSGEDLLLSIEQFEFDLSKGIEILSEIRRPLSRVWISTSIVVASLEPVSRFWEDGNHAISLSRSQPPGVIEVEMGDHHIGNLIGVDQSRLERNPKRVRDHTESLSKGLIFFVANAPIDENHSVSIQLFEKKESHREGDPVLCIGGYQAFPQRPWD